MIHNKKCRAFFLTLPLLCCASLLFAADLVKPAPPVSLKFVPAAGAKAGSTVDATIEVTIKKPWHIFGANPGVEGLTPVEFSMDSCTGATVEKIVLSKPSTVYSKVFEKNLSLYEDKMTVTLTLKIAEGTSGKVPLQGTFHYQACSDTTCLPPKREPLMAAQILENP